MNVNIRRIVIAAVLTLSAKKKHDASFLILFFEVAKIHIWN